MYYFHTYLYLLIEYLYLYCLSIHICNITYWLFSVDFSFLFIYFSDFSLLLLLLLFFDWKENLTLLKCIVCVVGCINYQVYLFAFDKHNMKHSTNKCAFYFMFYVNIEFTPFLEKKNWIKKRFILHEQLRRVVFYTFSFSYVWLFSSFKTRIFRLHNE